MMYIDCSKIPFCKASHRPKKPNDLFFVDEVYPKCETKRPGKSARELEQTNQYNTCPGH